MSKVKFAVGVMSNDAKVERAEKTRDDVWEELRKTVENEYDLVTIYLHSDEHGFGFNIRGGIDHPHVGCDTGIFVTNIRAKSAAGLDGRLSRGDRILAVNEIRLDNITHDDAVKAFRMSDVAVTMLVEKGAEQRILGKPKTPKSPLSPEAGCSDQVDTPFSEGNSGKRLPSAVTSFLDSTLGALSLGIMAGSLAVFVGIKVYRAMAK
ncbi:disks large homolog 1-like [Actinia tenebrosa]|uniref:Disks large homolog 1-like n=1 Tax=Actinia tenebrosa TaxID=6105 RepID=A0A6P8I6L3_ACTTE|nr:disks large homolog 1-like [Actinia tenebrosa]